MVQELKKIMDFIAYPVCFLTDRRLWYTCYYTAKKCLISSAINCQLFIGTNELPTEYDSHIVPYCNVDVCGRVQVFNAEMEGRGLTEFSLSHFKLNYFEHQKNDWKNMVKPFMNVICFDVHQNKKYSDDFVAFSRGVVCMGPVS